MPEKKVTVVTRGGVRVSLPESEAQKKIEKGEVAPEGRVSSIVRKARKEDRIQHTNAEDKIQALGEGILGALSLGGTDLIFGEDAGKRAEYNKGWRLTGEMLGLAGGITGGSGKNVLSFTPAGALFGGSRIAGSKIDNIIARRFTEGVIEGGGLGAAQVFSDAGLYNQPITTERLAGSITTGGLIGGGVGLLFGGGQAITARQAAKAAERVHPFYNVGSEASEVYWKEHQSAFQAAGRVDDFLARGAQLSDEAAVAQREAFEAGFARNPEAPLTGPSTVGGKKIAQTTPEGQTLLDESLITPPGQIRQPSPVLGEKVTPTGQVKFKQQFEFEPKTVRVTPGETPTEAGRRLIGETDTVARERQAAELLERQAAEDAVGREVFEGAATAELKLPVVVGSDAPGLLQEFRAARQKLTEKLGDEGFGPHLVRRSKDEFLDVVNAYDDFLNVIRKIDDVHLTNFADEVGGAARRAGLMLGEEAQTALAKLSTVDTAELAVATGMDPRRLAGLGEDARGIVHAYALGRTGVQNQAKAVIKDFNRWVNKLDEGGKIKDPLVRGGFLRAAAAPVVYSTPFMWLHIVESVGRTAMRAERAMRKFVTAGSHATVKRQAITAAITSPVVSKPVLDVPKEVTKGAKTPVAKRMAEINWAAANPEATRQTVDEMLIPLRAANPEAGFRVADIIMNRLAYLHQKMPKVPVMSPLIRSHWEPTVVEAERWARYLESAEDPIGRLEKELKSGMVSVQLVETLKLLYPEMYNDLRETALNEAMRKPPKYEVRIALSTLFDAELDPAANVHFGRTMQQTNALAEQGGSGGIPVSQTALKENVQNTLTKGQQITER